MAYPPNEFKLNPSFFHPELYKSILKFWLPTFPEQSSQFSQPDVQRWFAQSDTVDTEIQTLAGAALSSIGPEHLMLPPFTDYNSDRQNANNIAAPFISHLESSNLHTALALVILLDQFPRNLFRGSAQAVVYTHYDRLARAVAGLVPTICYDDAFSPVWRYWLLLPLEHSEALVDHERLGTKLRELLGTVVGRGDDFGVKFTEQAIRIAERHLKPLQQFQRFPWRNKWLGRESTEEEEKWLRDDGDHFGTG